MLMHIKAKMHLYVLLMHFWRDVPLRLNRRGRIMKLYTTICPFNIATHVSTRIAPPFQTKCDNLTISSICQTALKLFIYHKEYSPNVKQSICVHLFQKCFCRMNVYRDISIMFYVYGKILP